MIMSANAAETRRIVETLYACGKALDVPGALAMMHDDIVVHEPPFLPYGGPYKGHDGFVNLFTLMGKEYLNLAKISVGYLVVEGDKAFAVIRCPAHSGGNVMLAEESIVRGDKVASMRIYYHDSASFKLRS